VPIHFNILFYALNKAAFLLYLNKSQEKILHPGIFILEARSVMAADRIILTQPEMSLKYDILFECYLDINLPKANVAITDNLEPL
jgi:hypothetical protein